MVKDDAELFMQFMDNEGFKRWMTDRCSSCEQAVNLGRTDVPEGEPPPELGVPRPGSGSSVNRIAPVFPGVSRRSRDCGDDTEPAIRLESPARRRSRSAARAASSASRTSPTGNTSRADFDLGRRLLVVEPARGALARIEPRGQARGPVAGTLPQDLLVKAVGGGPQLVGLGAAHDSLLESRRQRRRLARLRLGGRRIAQRYKLNRTSPTTVRRRMSPKMCCWMLRFMRFVTLTSVVIAPAFHVTPKLPLTSV